MVIFFSKQVTRTLQATLIKICFKENARFVQKVTFKPLDGFFKKNMEVGNITKAATFKSFLPLSY